MNTFDIKLDRTEYDAGETATGRLLISADRELVLANLKFSAFGAEFIIISDEPKSLQLLQIDLIPNSNFEEFNVLFSKDLSGFLYSSLGTEGKPLSTNSKGKIPKGNWTVPFEFTIPQDALESYQGKHAYIIYNVNVVAAEQQGLSRNIGKSLIFRVRNPKTNAEAISKADILKEEGPYTDLVTNGLAVAARFDFQGKSKFFQGEAIDGKLVLKNLKIKDIRKIQLSLKGIEYATAYANTVGFKQETVISEYRQNIEPISKLDNSLESIPFTIQTSSEAKRNYVGKHSEYYWVLGAKLDVTRARDITIERKIQIV
jgi:Arrestin (or S-antigen), N-terminal domain